MLTQQGPVKQLVILSGKGGTGKTSLSAALAHLTNTQKNQACSVLVDADVDAANLDLILQPDRSESHEFWGGAAAIIEPADCLGCGACFSVCRFDAIHPVGDGEELFEVDDIACDGCAACLHVCPQHAIRMELQQDGLWFTSTTPEGPLFHAELFPGKENSGKLVTLIRQHARLFAEDNHHPLIIVDGPPGIGCPVISACAGADLGLIIAEPGVSGIHDLRRILGTLQHFRIPALISINKSDIYPPGAEEIHAYAKTQDTDVIGEIPYDPLMPQAILQGKPVTAAFPESSSAKAIRSLWEKISHHLFDKESAR